jgi:membrane protease YdiL (CAAX protease family)
VSIEIKKSLQKKPLITYLVTTFLFTWLIWGLLYASDTGMISRKIYESRFRVFDSRLVLFIFIGGSMPSILAVIFTGIQHGKSGIKALLKSLLIWRVNPLWYAFALLFVFAVYHLPYLICNLLGDTFPVYIGKEYYLIPIHFIGAFIFWGPMGEEFGWRGYVLPRLQAKFNPLISSIILGVIWAAWHLPLFFISNSSQYGNPFSNYIMQVIGFSIFYTWIYNNTKGSLLLAGLYHAASNYTANVVRMHPSHLDPTKYFIISNLFYLIFLSMAVWDMFKSKGSKTFSV